MNDIKSLFKNAPVFRLDPNKVSGKKGKESGTAPDSF